MDTPIQESSGELSEAQSVEMFNNLLSEPKEKPAPAEAEPGAVQEPEAPEPNETEEGADADEGDETAELITVKIDGKDVQLTPDQIAEAYKSGLKEKDYRQKTMALSKERDAAQAEKAKASEERQQYAQNLQGTAQQLQALLQIQDKIDWDDLVENNPQEFLRQRNLYNKRQTALNQHHAQLQQVQAQQAAEAREQRENFVANQREEMLAKIPAWKDATKAKTEMSQIAEYLKDQGYDEKAINDITDHRPVVMARKAMLYDQIMGKAQAATKKVATLPARIERPGIGDSPSTDKRSAAFQRLKKTGRDADAVALFNSIL